MVPWRLALAASLLCGPLAAQTPPGYHPQTEQRLTVSYDGVGAIEPGQILNPAGKYQCVLLTPTSLELTGLPDAQGRPRLRFSDAKLFYRYIAVMIDAAVQHDRTVTSMLHWIQPGLYVQSAAGALLNISDRSVPYVGPQPNPGPAHAYVLLLFEEPPDFSLPACFDHVYPPTVAARAGFDIDHFAAVVGLKPLRAATWFRAGSSHQGALRPQPTTTSLHRPECHPTLNPAVNVPARQILLEEAA